MRIRASMFTFATWAALLVAVLASGCTHPSAKLMVDSPKMLPYQAPDADEIAGIDSDEEDAKPAKGAAQKPQK